MTVLIVVVAVSLGMVAVVFALALARVAAKPTPPVCGPVGEDHNMPEAITFTIPGRLPGLNEYTAANRTHPKAGARAKTEAEWQVAWGVKIARLEPIDGPVFLTFAWHEPDHRRDVDNVAFAKKFILDALVRLGILAGDGRKHVVGFTDEFHLDRRRPRVDVTIERTSA
jgi:Holliday junction resolvase RusA-like endonuclease